MVRSRSRRLNWKGAAESLAAAIPMSRIHPDVERWANSRSQAARGPWCVAFSGGADSLALLLLIWGHWGHHRSRIIALHFNHRLRGAQSGNDVRFCRAVCAALDVEFRAGSWKRAKAPAEISEARAREARFEFFREEQGRLEARALWLGHQKDDIAETMLMRLARGSGTAGLAAPRPIQRFREGWFHVRPLIGLSKLEIESALGEIAVPWRVDSTNAKLDFLRNRMRNQVLPTWIKAAEPRDALSGAGLSRSLLQEDDDALELWVDRIRAQRGLTVNLRALEGAPRAVVRRVLQRWRASLAHRAGDLSRQGFEVLLDAVERGTATRLSMGRNGFAQIRDFRLSYCEKVTKSRC
ncbi:MAG: tRNA lysidine(34) synthetase TilS [Opitutaceae bacterium]|nr:tRNA lysidine(34) synthetase TilS [Opitutaceae bacterium]